MAEEDKDRRGIQSIEVGGALLQALVAHGAPMMLKDLARAAGMSPAKAHPYLVSYGKLALVRQDPLTGRYALGAFALQMGLAALHEVEPLRETTPEVVALADALQVSIAVAVWGNLGPTIVRIEESNRQIHVNMRPGTVMTPLMQSATGRLFAAFLPARLVGPVLEAERDGESPAEERAILDEVVRERLARAIGNPIPGINAFSAPVFDSGGHLALAITAMGPAGSFPVEWDGPLARALKDCAARISRRLGCAA